MLFGINKCQKGKKQSFVFAIDHIYYIRSFHLILDHLKQIKSIHLIIVNSCFFLF